jgi:hypothetical protein
MLASLGAVGLDLSELHDGVVELPPWLSGALSEVQVIHRIKAHGVGEQAGWFLRATTRLDSSWAAIYTFLRDTLALTSDGLTLEVSMQLAHVTDVDFSWTSPIDVHSFSIVCIILSCVSIFHLPWSLNY